MNPTVSICLPTYRQTVLLKENLDSVFRQTVRPFEVLVWDDSPGDEVENLVRDYIDKLPVQYQRNRPSLGSPANWNAVLKKATGDFVLLLHHDDQFAAPDSLEKLLSPLLRNASLAFAFGRNETTETLSKGKPFPMDYFNRYYDDPSLLVVENTLGAPSNVLFQREAVEFYDERFQWIVDVECYTRLFRAQKSFAYLDEHLVRTGRHEGQITNACVGNSEVQLFENITYAAENIGQKPSLAVFDFYWRLLRNNVVKDVGDLLKAGIDVAALPKFITQILKAQKRIPQKLLRNGAFSKPAMTATYLSLS